MTDLVRVEVLETSRTGVQVRILDDQYANRAGFIRRQELSWDRRVEVDPPWPKVGDRMEAKVLGGKDARFVRLSLRLGDPWKNEQVEERFLEGQVVQGQVVQISRYGAFVQLAPGVDALARTATIPTFPKQWEQGTLAVGDKLEAVIIGIDPQREQIEIDLIERLRRLSLLSAEERRSLQIDLFRDIPSPKEQALELEALNALEGIASEPGFRHNCPSLEKMERILIVEDTEADLREMSKRIDEAFEVSVEHAISGKQALKKAKEGTEYDLILIDVNLQEEDTIEIAKELRAAQPSSAFIFMSHDPTADDKLPGGSAFALKDSGFASILQCMREMLQVEAQQIDDKGVEANAQRRDFVHHLGMEAFARRSLEETLQPMLHRLRLQTQVSAAILFRVDPVEKQVTIVAQDPWLEENTQKHLLDGLYFSPVQNIVEDEDPYYETSALIRFRHPRFPRLYAVLPFRCCLGLPLVVPNLETRHALFLFDENRGQLELEDLDNARLAVRFLVVALERSAFFEFMQNYEKRYSRGLLMGSLMHELSIKLNTLGMLVEALPATLRKVSYAVKPADRSKAMQDAREIAEELRENSEGFKALTDAYLQMARENWEAVDVHAVVEKVKLQMNKLAEETEVTICIEAGDVPPARAISSRLEQILLNLVLNAIQQIGRQREMMAKLPRGKESDLVLLQKGELVIQTRFVESDPACPIQILVIDTGPGVRYPDQKRIFRLDTSTREEGHGWGLFISRNLVEIMRGRLRLVGSLRFIGSVFAVELPMFSSGGAK